MYVEFLLCEYFNVTDPADLNGIDPIALNFARAAIIVRLERENKLATMNIKGLI